MGQKLETVIPDLEVDLEKDTNWDTTGKHLDTRLEAPPPFNSLLHLVKLRS